MDLSSPRSENLDIEESQHFLFKDEEMHGKSNASCKMRLSNLTVATSILLSVFLLLAGVFGWSLGTHSRPSLPLSCQDGRGHPLETSCGDDVDTARSNGCFFDIMSFSWLPPLCYDGELVEQFLGLQDWRWYADAGGKQPVPKEEVLAGQHPELFVSGEYHQFHCTYMWRKLHRAILGNGRVDSYIGNYHHTEHCEKMLTSPRRGGDALNTIIRSKFTSCRSLDM